MNTLYTNCYFCGNKLPLSEAVNYQGHYSHRDCWSEDGMPDRPVPRMWENNPALVADCPNGEEIISECHEICELLLTKNRAYGSSFASPLQVFSKLSPVEAINARIDDKLARIKQAKDFTEDTEADLIGYLILKRIAMRLGNEATA